MKYIFFFFGNGNGLRVFSPEFIRLFASFPWLDGRCVGTFEYHANKTVSLYMCIFRLNRYNIQSSGQSLTTLFSHMVRIFESLIWKHGDGVFIWHFWLMFRILGCNKLVSLNVIEVEKIIIMVSISMINWRNGYFLGTLNRISFGTIGAMFRVINEQFNHVGTERIYWPIKSNNVTTYHVKLRTENCTYLIY